MYIYIYKAGLCERYGSRHPNTRCRANLAHIDRQGHILAVTCGSKYLKKRLRCTILARKLI